MPTHDPIRAYTRTLARHLRALDPADAADVVAEIESHIHDAIELAEAGGETVNVPALLERFGAPETLAAQYIAHIRHGAPPPSGFRVLQRVRHSVTRGLYFSMGAFGFSIAACLLLLAVAKMFDPASVGVWSTNAGQHVTIGWSGAPRADARELLGIAFVPVAMLAAAWCAQLTRRVLRVLKHGLA
jgi:hypothetical protein